MSAVRGSEVELVVLVGEDGEALGTQDKATVHHRATPLHLAFSCYVFDDAGRVLVTQRALSKVTWPGVWTNSVCGHPAPGEDLAAAVRRRAADELGLEIADVRLVLPAFRYRAVMDNGVVENELCPVYVARTAGPAHLDPSEVEAAEWVPWARFRDEVRDGTRAVSPWCVTQVADLAEREDGDGWFLPGDAVGPAGSGPLSGPQVGRAGGPGQARRWRGRGGRDDAARCPAAARARAGAGGSCPRARRRARWRRGRSRRRGARRGPGRCRRPPR